MAGDPIQDILASVRARLEQELDGQLRALSERHQQALAEARRNAEAEAEERWSVLLNEARAETQQHVEAAVTASRAEFEQERQRDVAAAREQVRRESSAELAEAVAAARRSAQAELDRARREAAEQLERMGQELDAERLRASQHPARSPGPSLSDDLQRLDASGSLSETLAALVRSAAARTERAAVFIANGSRLDEWTVPGIAPLGEQATHGASAALLDEALLTGAAVRGTDGAFAAPLLLETVPVGVLYGAPASTGVPDDWASSLEVLARHGAAHMAYLTALRTAQARQWLATEASSIPSGGGILTSEDDEASARRYARLLVSEIKLYNDAAVRAGREQRDLLRRLGPEIDRARRLYEERVPAHVAGRTQHFHDELVQTLAGGDSSLLN